MDRYDERLIEGKATLNTFLLMGLSILIALLGVVCMCFIHFMGGVVIIIGAIILGTFIVKGFNIEYEYILTNGDIEIAKIISKERRKTVFDAREGDIKLMDRADSDKVKNDLSLGKKVKKFIGKEIQDTEVALYFGEDSQNIVILDLDQKCIDHLKQVIKSRCNIK